MIVVRSLEPPPMCNVTADKHSKCLGFCMIFSLRLSLWTHLHSNIHIHIYTCIYICIHDRIHSCVHMKMCCPQGLTPFHAAAARIMVAGGINA